MKFKLFLKNKGLACPAKGAQWQGCQPLDEQVYKVLSIVGGPIQVKSGFHLDPLGIEPGSLAPISSKLTVTPQTSLSTYTHPTLLD